MEALNTIHNTDCLTGLRELPSQSVNCCVTSPPYYGLRDYGHDGQIGLEETPEAYVQKLVDVFREVRRVLRDDGTLWLNLGDTYNAYKANTWDTDFAGHSKRPEHKQGLTVPSLKQKDLIGIPWLVAFALRADGWYLRQDIIWHKPNPMPESVTDRCTKSHEYIFLLSKSARYYYDAEAIKQPIADSSVSRLNQDVENQKGSDRVPGKTNGTMKAVGNGWDGSSFDRDKTGEMKHTRGKGYTHRGEGDKKLSGHSGNYDANGNLIGNGLANKRSVWTVTPKPFKESHFATFPPDLIVDCIKAGCPEDGIVLDPFMGAGTTAMVARKLNRNYVGYELNPEYIAISERRLAAELGLFA